MPETRTMRKVFLLALLAVSLGQGKAQEQHGNTLNIAPGFSYGFFNAGFGMTANYEIDVAENITVAPFIGFYTARYNYGWYNPGHGYYGTYYYRLNSIPFGAKAAYYFDDLLEADDKWDFYGALSLGLVFTSFYTNDPYPGYIYPNYHSLFPYLALHAGARYHVSDKIGVFLDLSTSNSTAGISIGF